MIDPMELNEYRNAMYHKFRREGAEPKDALRRAESCVLEQLQIEAVERDRRREIRKVRRRIKANGGSL